MTISTTTVSTTPSRSCASRSRRTLPTRKGSTNGHLEDWRHRETYRQRAHDPRRGRAAQRPRRAHVLGLHHGRRPGRPHHDHQSRPAAPAESDRRRYGATGRAGAQRGEDSRIARQRGARWTTAHRTNHRRADHRTAPRDRGGPPGTDRAVGGRPCHTHHRGEVVVKKKMWIVVAVVAVVVIVLGIRFSQTSQDLDAFNASVQRWHVDCDRYRNIPDRQLDDDGQRCLSRLQALTAYGKEHGWMK